MTFHVDHVDSFMKCVCSKGRKEVADGVITLLELTILVGLHAFGKNAVRLEGKREKKDAFARICVHCIDDGIMVDFGTGFITADTAALEQAA